MEAFNEEDIYGEGIIDSLNKFVTGKTQQLKQYVGTVMHGRNDYPPNVRKLIGIYGAQHIKGITIDRTPVPGVLTSIMNMVSLGKFKQKLDALPYDKLYHLRLDLMFNNNKKLAVEKNEVINMYENPKRLEGSQQKNVIFMPGVTLNELLDGAKKYQGDKFFKYSAYNNNCQDFVVALLKGSRIGDDQDINFIKQDVSSLFENDPILRKVSNTVTDLGAKVNEIVKGTGIQSVLFKRPKWTHRKAVNWLKKHNFKGLDLDEKPEHLRYRQVEPNDKYEYRTHKIGDDIEFILYYKPKRNKNKIINGNNIMDSDKDYSSSDSDSDSETGSIIRGMTKLRKRIHNHQKIHGGKINIAKSFKKLGSTIKKGFDTAEHYVTAKKGGLASDLLHKALPTVAGTLAGAAAEAIAPEGGPVSGFLGNQAGKYAGNQLANYIGSKTGVGMRNVHTGAMGAGVKSLHIDINSHNASGKASNETSGDGLKRGRRRNASLEQLIKTKQERDEKELKKGLLKVVRQTLGRGVGRPAKGSPEAKEKMAKLRAMRKTR